MLNYPPLPSKSVCIQFGELMPVSCIYDVFPQVCIDSIIMTYHNDTYGAITYAKLILIIEVVRDKMYR